RPVDRLAQQAGHRDVLPLGAVVRLAGAEHGRALLAHQRPSITQTRFCCNAGPPVACARTRPAVPSEICLAASPILTSPPANIGVPASAPPDGVSRTVCPRRTPPRRISSWGVDGVHSAATSTPSPPARCAAA